MCDVHIKICNHTITLWTIDYERTNIYKYYVGRREGNTVCYLFSTFRTKKVIMNPNKANVQRVLHKFQI